MVDYDLRNWLGLLQRDRTFRPAPGETVVTYSSPPPDALQKPKRRRRLSWREAEKQAGRPVVVTDHPDGSRSYAPVKPEEQDGKINDWDEEYGSPATPQVRQ